MTDPRPARITALVAAMQQAHLDALLVSGLANVRYLTGFAGTSALLLVTCRADVVLITDFRYQTQVAEEVGDLARIVIEPQSLWAGLWQQLDDAAVRRGRRLRERAPAAPRLPAAARRRRAVDVASDRRPHRDASRAEGRERGRRDPRRGCRGRAGAGAHAGRGAARAHGARGGRHAGARAARGGQRGLPVRDDHRERAARRAAARACGSRASCGRATCCSSTSARSSRGYCADVTRTVVLGRADATQREVHDIVRAANAVASAQVRAGQSGRDADALARDYIAGRGYGEAFGHSLGHGLGLEVHEAPRLARTVETPLPPGSVVTIEPGIYLPGWGGVRIEDDVHLAPHRPGSPHALHARPARARVTTCHVSSERASRRVPDVPRGAVVFRRERGAPTRLPSTIP